VKALPGGIVTHLAQTVTTLSTCFMIERRDGQEFFFTDNTRDLVVGGETYLSAVGYERTEISNNDRLSVDGLEVTGIFDNVVILDTELRAGLFDDAAIQAFAVNWANTSQGVIPLRRGRLGEVILGDKGTFRVELRGLTQALSRVIVELSTPECRADLGDSRCKIPIDPPAVQRSTAYVASPNPDFVTAGLTNRIHECTTAGTTAASAPTYNSTVGGTTNDGTAVFTTREAWTREAVVTDVTNNRTFEIDVDEDRDVTGWFDGGLVTFVDGENAGVDMDIKTWTKTGGDLGDISLFLPMPLNVAVDDALLISPGCFKRLDEDCVTKFANAINYRGEPTRPGRDEFLRQVS